MTNHKCKHCKTKGLEMKNVCIPKIIKEELLQIKEEDKNKNESSNTSEDLIGGQKDEDELLEDDEEMEE